MKKLVCFLVVLAMAVSPAFALQGDINGNNTIGLEEAIYALQVSAGNVTDPPVGCTTPETTDVWVSVDSLKKEATVGLMPEGVAMPQVPLVRATIQGTFESAEMPANNFYVNGWLVKNATTATESDLTPLLALPEEFQPVLDVVYIHIDAGTKYVVIDKIAPPSYQSGDTVFGTGNYEAGDVIFHGGTEWTVITPLAYQVEPAGPFYYEMCGYSIISEFNLSEDEVRQLINCNSSLTAYKHNISDPIGLAVSATPFASISVDMSILGDVNPVPTFAGRFGITEISGMQSYRIIAPAPSQGTTTFPMCGFSSFAGDGGYDLTEIVHCY